MPFNWGVLAEQRNIKQSNGGLTRLSEAVVKSVGSFARQAYEQWLSDWGLRPATRNMIQTTRRSSGDL